ncbi:MAG: hypothetical protein WC389_22520 [Lutibacter sp.]|jgi:hypothetical protein
MKRSKAKMDENFDKQFIAKEYREFVDLANELTNKELPTSLNNVNKREDKITRHICNMLEMYSIRFGDYDERLRIVEYIERNLISATEDANETWIRLRREILSGGYKDLNDER